MRSGSRRTNRWLLAAAAAGAVALPALAAAPARPPVYERDVLPLLGGRCAGCHGAAAPHAGLDLRTGGDLLQGGYSGSPVVPGSPEKSLLYRMLQDGRMPKGGRKLTPPELAKVAAWIRAGARFTTGTGGHWAFRAPRLPAIPSADRVQGSVPTPNAQRRMPNPIDSFVLASLRQRGLGYSPEASPAVLIRRVTFDLIGLPPTPEEVDAYVKESSSSSSSSSNSGADRGRGRGRGRAEPPTPSAYDRLVDRLLADPRYGERWARHWLDAAGYADSEGVLQEDRIRPNAWRYRDYVIRSFNEDRPYDRFIREQIAGDELADYRGAAAFTDQVTEPLVATGFLRTAVDATRDDFNPHQYGEYQYRMLHDTQTIVSTAVMGLTVQCSRCHDHKYEPLSQRDYYRFQALFMGAVRPRGTLLPTSRRQIVAATAPEQERAKQVNAKVEAALAQVTQKETALLLEYRPQAIDAKLGQVPEAERAALREAALLAEAKRTPAQKELIARFKTIAEPGPEQIAAAFPEYGTRLAALKAEREAEAAKRVALPEIRAFYDQDAAPPPTPILIRGDWLRPGETVQPGVPAALDDPRRPFSVPAPAEGARTTGRRRALAEWLTRPDHPLTARVIVNRVWAHHFGAGLVPSVENFGRSGQRPTHPALLDWLAATFVERSGFGVQGSGSEPPNPNAERRTPNGVPPEPRTLNPDHYAMGWSLKKLHRLIVTSRAYRQASAWRPEAGKQDPDNRLLWRQRPRRLEAEAVRDAMLAVSGTLDGKMYGEPVGTETRGTGEVVAAGEDKGGRRSLYLLVRRSVPVTLLNTFDAPVMETNCTGRVTSTTATQALALLNGSFVASQAAHFARRVLRDQPAGTVDDPAPRLMERAYHLALGRHPSAPERAATLSFLREQSARYRSGGKSPEAAAEAAVSDLCQTLLSSNEFVYVD